MKHTIQYSSRCGFAMLLLACCFTSEAVLANENPPPGVTQQKTHLIQGVVKDANGALPGVVVQIKNTSIGTLTDVDGKYQLQVKAGEVLQFTFMGYHSQEVAVVNQSVLNMEMVQDTEQLDEITINAGYYSVKDKERTGSISKITSKEISQQPVANPLAAMQGRMAGVNITQNSGTPGGGFNIEIRGRNSLRNDGNAPLYIVDGVPFVSQSVSDGTISSNIFSAGNISPLNSMNPNDIESIEVLKDADATAIYGSRGSNGVVLITTKRSRGNKNNIFLHASTGISQISNQQKLMDTQTYLKMRRIAFENDGMTTLPSNAYDVDGTWGENNYTNWQDKFIGKQAIATNQMISISGGNQQTTYLINADNRVDGNVFPGDFKYKRTNFSMNLGHQSIDKRFIVNANMKKSNQRNNLMAVDFTNKIYLSPNAPDLYNENGTLNWENNTFENPLSSLNAKYISEIGDVTGQIALKYELLKNVRLGINAGFTESNILELTTLPSTVYNPAYGFTSEYSSISQSNGKRLSWIVEPQVSWIKTLNNSKLEVLFGSTFESRSESLFSIQGSNFTSNDLILNISNAVNQKVLTDSESDYKYAAIFGRINYSHLDKYILNITGRRDGSSRFGVNNRFANFGAIGAAWLFSNEKIFENIEWLNFGKFRTSYGIAGSDLIGDYQYLNTFGIGYNKYDEVSVLEPLRLFNPNFSWETNKKLELALELEFLNGRLSPSISWYRNRSSNQLVGMPLPGTTGFNTIQSNLNATVENTGWEFTLNTINLQKEDWSWTTSVNLSFPKNKLIAFPGLEESTYANQFEVGRPIMIKKVYNLLGVNEITGLYEFEDVNSDGRINIEDRTTIADLGTSFFGGIYNSITYKKLSVDFLWNFVKQTGYTPDYHTSMSGTFNNQLDSNSDYWTPNNITAKYQKPSTGSNKDISQAYQNYKLSNGVIEDQYYIKLRNVQINYAFERAKNAVFQMNIFVQGQNLLTFSNRKGFDPETIGGYLPQSRIVNFGFNINF